jgi:S-adenosylmethionine:tRNA ribosyltransferase-isomerase
MLPTFSFTLPDELVATAPPERRGLARDKVRLLVTDRATGRVVHSRFDHLREFVRAGDLLVFNASRTMPASLKGVAEPGRLAVEARLAEHLPDGSWLALLVCYGSDPFGCPIRPGVEIAFGQDLRATVCGRDQTIPRLWNIRFSATEGEFMQLLYRLGQPIRYEYVSAAWGLDAYQTVYATEPGSAEMPSAGRAFTWQMLFDLKRGGIETAFVVLHTGLSSYLDDDLDARNPAAEEEYDIGEAAAARINTVRERGGRVIAVGTTVVRALESASDEAGHVRPAHEYTRLRITPHHRLKAVDGLLTGLHEPHASHLDLLSALISPSMIEAAYEAAIERGYLWHEFGDLNLII